MLGAAGIPVMVPPDILHRGPDCLKPSTRGTSAWFLEYSILIAIVLAENVRAEGWREVRESSRLVHRCLLLVDDIHIAFKINAANFQE